MKSKIINITTSEKNPKISRDFETLNSKNILVVFGFLWLLVFVLYFPAEKAGWVSDTTQWLDRIKHETFWNFINITQSRGGLYQGTQIITYILYLIFGSHQLPWHLLFITIQTTNATLLYIIVKKMLDEMGYNNSFLVSFGATLLFSTCPHISEVIIWKASYHYLQAMLFMLLILFSAQQFQSSQNNKYAYISICIYFIASFTHEFFLLIPFFVFSLALFYYLVLKNPFITFKRTIIYFLIPFLVILGIHFAIIRLEYGNISANLGDEINQPLITYLRKPPLYIFHILFCGRFYSHDTREIVYVFFGKVIGLALFYGSIIAIYGYIILKFKTISKVTKFTILILTWMLACMALVVPAWFPEVLLVDFDRYTYFMLPFIYVLLAFYLLKISGKKVATFLMVFYLLINLSLTHKENQLWCKSEKIVNKLVHNLPSSDNKTTLLLNLPEYMNGVRMIGPFLNYSFARMYNVYHDVPITNRMIDVVSYNMTGENDGVHIMVINDTLIHVTLNQWGTWWWSNMVGASSYENKDFKFNLIDPGHWYELALKRPADSFVLLFQTGDKWKIVDMKNKNIDQY